MDKDIIIGIKDDSGDKEFFTIIPNFILNHSTHYEQIVYVQMKRMAGEHGTFRMSMTNLAKKIGMDRNRLRKSIDYLVKNKWITPIGKIKGKTHPLEEYSINNLWKLNSNHYRKDRVVFRPISEKQDRSGGIPSDDRMVFLPKEEGEKKNRKEEVYILCHHKVKHSSQKLCEAVSLIDYFVEKHQEQISDKKLTLSYGRYLRTVIKLNQSLSPKRMKELVDAYFESDDKFFEKQDWSINYFLSDHGINKLNINT